MKDKDPGKKISHYYQHHAAPSSAIPLAIPPPHSSLSSDSSPSVALLFYFSSVSPSRGDPMRLMGRCKTRELPLLWY